MDRDRLVLGLAATFAGITTVLVVLAFVKQLFLLVVALPFGVTAYFMWQHATGRLEAKIRSGARARARAAGQRSARDASRGPRDFRGGRRRGPGGANAQGRNARTGRTATRPSRTPSRTEAYRTLDLDPGASEAEIRRAYRTKVKEVHPDADSGDEEAFKRVNRAYETLTD